MFFTINMISGTHERQYKFNVKPISEKLLDVHLLANERSGCLDYQTVAIPIRTIQKVHW